jgi:hypothetical protein
MTLTLATGARTTVWRITLRWLTVLEATAVPAVAAELVELLGAAAAAGGAKRGGEVIRGAARCGNCGTGTVSTGTETVAAGASNWALIEATPIAA